MDEKQTAMFDSLGEALRDSMPIDEAPPFDAELMLRQLRAAEAICQPGSKPKSVVPLR